MINFTHKLNEIAALWEADLPASKIASRLGMTKGTVCGLIHRARRDGDLRFPLRPQPFASRLRKKTPVRRFISDLSRLAKVPPRSKFGEVPLMGLRPNDCRYPTETLEHRGEYLFCGAPMDPKSEAYCEVHHKLCVAGVYVRKYERVSLEIAFRPC